MHTHAQVVYPHEVCVQTVVFEGSAERVLIGPSILKSHLLLDARWIPDPDWSGGIDTLSTTAVPNRAPYRSHSNNIHRDSYSRRSPETYRNISNCWPWWRFLYGVVHLTFMEGVSSFRLFFIFFYFKRCRWWRQCVHLLWRNREQERTCLQDVNIAING